MGALSEIREEVVRVRAHVHEVRAEVQAILLRLESMSDEIDRNRDAWQGVRPVVERLSKQVETATTTMAEAATEARTHAAVARAIQERGVVIPLRTVGRLIVIGSAFTTALIGAMAALHSVGVF